MGKTFTCDWCGDAVPLSENGNDGLFTSVITIEEYDPVYSTRVDEICVDCHNLLTALVKRLADKIS